MEFYVSAPGRRVRGWTRGAYYRVPRKKYTPCDNFSEAISSITRAGLDENGNFHLDRRSCNEGMFPFMQQYFRIPTISERSTSGFPRPGSHCLHQAPGAVRCSASESHGGWAVEPYQKPLVGTFLHT